MAPVPMFLRAALAALLPFSLAHAAPAAADKPLEEIVIRGAGSQVDLTESFTGGQVARGGRAGLLGNLDYMDSPFSGTAYTQALVRDQQARSVGDVLQNDPGVRVAKGFGNFQEVYVVRGFPVFSDDMTLNGVYGILPRQFVAAELLERVEVFRGANAFLNGAAPGGSGVGGAFNLVPKRATAAPLTRLTFGFENDGHGYTALDAGRRFGPGDSLGVRLNVVGRAGEMAIDDQDRALGVVSLNTDYQGERLRLSADFGYQDHSLDDPRPQVTPLGSAPAAPDAEDNFAQPWTFSDERQLFGVARGEFDVTEQLGLWLAFGGRRGEEENRLANPSATPDGATTTYRFHNTREDAVLSTDGGLRLTFATGAIEHRLITSASATGSDSDNAYAFSNFFVPLTSNLNTPTASVAPTPDFFTGGDLSNPLRTEAVRNWSVAVADTMSAFDGRILATVGVRHQSIETRSFDYNSGTKLTEYSDEALTPVGALVLRVHPSVALYANYAESLQPGEIAPALSGGVPVTNVGEVLSAFRGEQVEVGVKLDRQAYGATMAAFMLNKPNSIVEGGVFSNDGEQQSQGLEFSVFGEPLAGLRVLGGATFIDAELERTANGVNEGNTPTGVPEVQVNVNLEWDVPRVPGLTVDGRVIYTDSQYINAANTFDIPSWTRFDLGARYATRIAAREVSLRARVENLGGRDYWASAGGFPGANYLVLGMPRTFIVSASMDF